MNLLQFVKRYSKKNIFVWTCSLKRNKALYGYKQTANHLILGHTHTHTYILTQNTDINNCAYKQQQTTHSRKHIHTLTN